MSLTQHFKKVVEHANKKSLLGFFTSWEFGKAIVDGNLGHNIIMKASDGKLVGTDYNGNKYFENPELPYGRKRWVQYADTFNYNPTSVPPEWHGWLNHINDYEPGTHDFKKPKFAVVAKASNTGSFEAYAPKGSWKNPQKRNWLKYEKWTPTSTSS